MKLHQLSIFLENQPGQLRMACQLLADAGINILTLSLADTKQFGILRLLVKDWQQGQKVLEEAGFVIKVTEVLAVEVSDRPGGLASVLKAIEAAHLNVEYMYAFTFGRNDKAVMIFRFDDPDGAVSRLQAGGVNVIGSPDLFGKK